MRTVLYLFNGNGWGDHFLSLPFIKTHLSEHGGKGFGMSVRCIKNSY
jgi:hypothetical protein